MMILVPRAPSDRMVEIEKGKGVVNDQFPWRTMLPGHMHQSSAWGGVCVEITDVSPGPEDEDKPTWRVGLRVDSRLTMLQLVEKGVRDIFLSFTDLSPIEIDMRVAEFSTRLDRRLRGLDGLAGYDGTAA